MHLSLLLLLFGFVCGDSYNEELKITRLPSGANYSLFPRIVAELIHSHSLAELSFMLTQGRWHSSSWGLPPQPNGPTGASVHAWIYGNETEYAFTADDRWRTLINSLNGLFCTAMTSIVPELTSSPRFAFSRPDSDKEHEMHIRYSAVGKESVCTENLTPWRKLLPCKQVRIVFLSASLFSHGLVTLLNPLKLYESVYHSMGVELRQTGQGANNNYQLQLIIYNVFDIPVKSGKLDWSISDLFNRKATGTCAAATSSEVIVELDKGIHLEPPPQRIVSDKFGVYDLKTNSSSPSFSVSAFYDDMFDFLSSEEQETLSLSSFIGGTDQHDGVLVSILKNGGSSLRVTFTHQLPWFMMIYYHTIGVTCVDLEQGNEQVFKIHKRHFVPAISRRRPALIEMELELPSRSKCQVRLEFEKAFLRIREYPPDANHGMYVPAAVVTFEKEHQFLITQNDRIIAGSPAEASQHGGIAQRSGHPKSLMVFGAITSDGKDWCATHFPDFISSKDWPLNSLDLNPLDYSGVIRQACSTQHRSLGALRATLVNTSTSVPPSTRFLGEFRPSLTMRELTIGLEPLIGSNPIGMLLMVADKQETGATERIVVHGNVLLLALPVPDFSMPFNVICFVMTTVSLCFGPIHSFSTKILIPINTALPSSSLPRKLFRMLLLILLGVAFYAQYREMSLHEIRRSIEQFFEKMNSV
ncbi:unnamed protein product [Haemonchus placei]|uniref:GPI transamidase component PIG-T n=1 Tax=Haemonchus placei TaxID=6290 RepID=A0A158QMD0_HAEPC|nr:unnamed protein product [Haemonchus placei]